MEVSRQFLLEEIDRLETALNKIAKGYVVRTTDSRACKGKIVLHPPATKKLNAQIKELKNEVDQKDITIAGLTHQRNFYRTKLNEAKGTHIAKDLGIDENIEIEPITQSSESYEIKELKSDNTTLHDSLKSIQYENSRLILERDGLKAENERLKSSLANSIEAKVGLHKDYIRLNTELDRVQTDSNNKDLVIDRCKESFKYIIECAETYHTPLTLRVIIDKAKVALEGGQGER